MTRPSSFFRIAGVMMLAAALASPACAAGYYNMPSSLGQMLGFGFGPGYHAPLLLGPSLKAGIEAKRVVRLPVALAPPPQSFVGPSYYASPAHTSPAWTHGAAAPATGYSMAPISEPTPTLASPAYVPMPPTAAPATSASSYDGYEVVPAPGQ